MKTKIKNFSTFIECTAEKSEMIERQSKAICQKMADDMNDEFMQTCVLTTVDYNMPEPKFYLRQYESEGSRYVTDMDLEAIGMNARIKHMVLKIFIENWDRSYERLIKEVGIK